MMNMNNNAKKKKRININKKRKNKHSEEICIFENMSVLNSDEESLNITSGKEDEI